MDKKCDYCGVKLTGNRRRFCCNKHKDKYHNRANPRGKFAYLANTLDNDDDWNFDDMDGHFSNEDN